MRMCRFIIESVKPVQLRKCISLFNKIFLSQYKLFLKIIQIFDYRRFSSLQ